MCTARYGHCIGVSGSSFQSRVQVLGHGFEDFELIRYRV